MNDHESLITAFILKSKRERYKEFLASAKGRKKFVAQLAHFKHLDPAACKPITPHEQNPLSITSLLRRAGAPGTCWVISEAEDLDRKELQLEDALHEIVGNQMGSLVSCIPGRLGYFEDEDERFILSR